MPKLGSFQQWSLFFFACCALWYGWTFFVYRPSLGWIDLVGVVLFVVAYLSAVLPIVSVSYQHLIDGRNIQQAPSVQLVLESNIAQTDTTQTVPKLDTARQAEVTQTVSELDIPKPVSEPDIAQAEVTQAVPELDMPKPVTAPDIAQAEVTQAVPELEIPKPVPELDIPKPVSELDIPQPTPKLDTAQTETAQDIPVKDVLQQAWELIPEDNPFRVAVKLLWEGYMDQEISLKTGLPLSLVQNGFYVLRKIFGEEIIPSRDDLKKKESFRKSQ